MTSEHHTRLSRGSIVALAAYIVLIAGVLVYVRRHAFEHPAVVFLEILGFPTLVLLVFILGTRGRTHDLRINRPR